MKLLLVRHAVAVPRGTPGVSDDERPLTSEGEAEFRMAARGLARIARRPDVLLTSPLPRARVTAEIAARAFKHIEPSIEQALARESVDGILAALKTHPCGAMVALVGHEPVLSAVLARLLGASQGERFAFEKGGAALVDLPDGPGAAGQLIWFLPARILKAVGADRKKLEDYAREKTRWVRATAAADMQAAKGQAGQVLEHTSKSLLRAGQNAIHPSPTTGAPPASADRTRPRSMSAPVEHDPESSEEGSA